VITQGVRGLQGAIETTQAVRLPLMHCGDGLGVGWGKAATVEQMNDGSRQQATVNAYLINIPS